jgi:hypothetical protein
MRLNVRLTQEDINKIADTVVEKILRKQIEYDFAYDQTYQHNLTYEMVLQQMVGLQLLLSEYITTEAYEKAELTKTKIQQLKVILDKLK